MIKINKFTEPDKFSTFKKKNKHYKNWDYYSCSEGFEIKKLLKESMLKEQNNYCPYCEIKIKSWEDANIEHIKPKDKFKNLFQDYKNLLAICKNNKCCGGHKKNCYDNTLFINPVEEDPEEFFTYDIMSGKIIPKIMVGIEKNRAEYTIKILNLNDFDLVEARKQILLYIRDSGKEHIKLYTVFPSLIKFLKNELFKMS